MSFSASISMCRQLYRRVTQCGSLDQVRGLFLSFSLVSPIGAVIGSEYGEFFSFCTALTWFWLISSGGDAGEKDVDIDDDLAPTKFAPVVIDKGRESSSSGSDSSDSGSSDSGKLTVTSWPVLFVCLIFSCNCLVLYLLALPPLSITLLSESDLGEA